MKYKLYSFYGWNTLRSITGALDYKWYFKLLSVLFNINMWKQFKIPFRIGFTDRVTYQKLLPLILLIFIILIFLDEHRV